jgi:hypothetical protein
MQLLTNCLTKKVLLDKEQHGLREGRSCSDCIFILRQIIQKRREFKLQTYFIY